MTFDEWAESFFKHGTDAEYGIAKAAWDAGVKAEREACVQTCLVERLSFPTDNPGDMAYEHAIADCVDGILKRSNAEITGSARSPS